jgi:hypothetical protein
MRNRAKAVLLLALSLTCLIGIQLAATQGNLCIAAEFGCKSEAGRAVLAVTGLVSGIGVEAAGIILCVNPWLALGIGAAYAG